MDDERSSDTAETFGSQDAPGQASNQNAEEPTAPTGGGSARRHDAETDRSSDPSDGTEGGAGEHSQATGNPHAAG